MKVRNIITLGGLGVLAWYFGSSIKQTFNNLVFAFKKVRIVGFKNLKLQIALDYEIQNNSGKEVTIQWYKGKLWYGNFLLGNIIVNQTALTIGETKALTLNLEIPILQLAGEIQKIIESKWFLYQFYTEGDLIFKVGNLPAISVHIKQNIQLAEGFTGGN